MRKLVPAIRAARIQVVIVPHHRWREGDYVGWKHVNPTQVVSNQAQAFAAGTWDGEFHPEFGPRDGDVVVLEHWAQSGFANTDLDAQLTQRGIEKIYLLAELTVWPGFVEEVKAILKEALIPTLREPCPWPKRDPGSRTRENTRSVVPIMAAIDVRRRPSCGVCHGLEHERMSSAQPAARPSRKRRLRSALFASERELVASDYAARRM